MFTELSRLRAKVHELEAAAGRASTTAGDTRREMADARVALVKAKRHARAALARAEAAETREAGIEREITELGRSEVRARAAQEGEQKATARADGAEKRVAALEGELGQAQAREAALEGAAAGLRDEVVKLGGRDRAPARHRAAAAQHHR